MSELREPKLAGLRLPPPVVEAMRAELPGCAERVVAAVVREVPSYSTPFQGRMGRNIETAVAMALGGFLDMTSAPEGAAGAAGTARVEGTAKADGQDADGADSRGRVRAVFDAAYALGRGEARSGRSMDALAAAYRVGARTAWHDLSTSAVHAGLEAAELARFAELVFDYIDQLSAVSVSGHADELATAGRVRERHLERLAVALLNGSGPDTLDTMAERAGWEPPTTLTAVLLPESVVPGVRQHLAADSLYAGNEAPGLDDRPDLTVVLAADMDDLGRSRVLRSLRERAALVGPATPWVDVRTSFLRVMRGLELGLDDADTSADTGDHLVTLALNADPGTLADLRARVLAPMEGLRPSTVEKLTETLRAWLLHQGRRDDIATALFVHPQTVRYRVGRLRELYGDRLGDPAFVLEATVALA